MPVRRTGFTSAVVVAALVAIAGQFALGLLVNTFDVAGAPLWARVSLFVLTVAVTLVGWLIDRRVTPETLFARQLQDLMARAGSPTHGTIEADIRPRLSNAPIDLDVAIRDTLEGNRRPTWELALAIIEALKSHAQNQYVALPLHLANNDLWQQRYNDLFSRPNRWRIAIVLIASSVTTIAVISYGLGAVGASRQEPAAQPPASTPLPTNAAPPSITPPSRVETQPATPAPSTGTSIEIDRLVNPPLCATFRGRGTPPPRYTLWLVVRSDEPRFYFFPATFIASDQWIATNVTLGLASEPAGEPFDIMAILIDADGTKAITADVLQNGLASLPAGVRTVDQYQVTRGPDTRECS